MDNKELTIRQKKFIQAYPESASATEAARMAGYSENSQSGLRVQAHRLLTNANIREELSKVLDNAELDDQNLASKLKTVIDSGLGQKATNSDALRGIEMALKIKDRFPTTKSAHLRIDVQENYKDMNYKEILDELATVRMKTEEFLKEVQA